MLYFWIFVFPNELLLYFNSFIDDIRILVINARWTILDIVNALKTVIFSSNFKFRIRHSLRTIPMLVICFRKFSLFSIFLLYEKWIPKILTVFNLFHATGLFRYPLKTWKNQRFSDVFRGYRMRPVAWNVLISSQYNSYQKKKKKTLWPLFMDGVQMPQG